MNTVTIHAVYADGVLKPTEKLDLPDGTPVEVEVKPISKSDQATPATLRSLAGLWSGLTTEQVDQLGEEIYALRRRQAERNFLSPPHNPIQ